MICLGTSSIAPTGFEPHAAQLRAFEMFREDFLRRFPGGVVLSELEYLDAHGSPAFPPRRPMMPRYAGRPELNRVLEALSQDYRRWIRPGDFRKSDGMGISGDGLHGELIEVTTVRRVHEADTQLRDKLDTLIHTVNGAHNLHVDWLRSRWRPHREQFQLFTKLPPKPDELLRHVCYEPTYRENAPQGVILYEIHAIKRPRGAPVPLPIPQDVCDRMHQMSRSRQLQPATAMAWAQQFAAEHPVLLQAVRGLALAAGITAAIAALLAIFDPVPGDEVAAGAAAAALVRFALSGSVAL